MGKIQNMLAELTKDIQNSEIDQSNKTEFINKVKEISDEIKYFDGDTIQLNGGYEISNLVKIEPFF